ncbi:MAG TPA: magnesium/cobalt transporter CorA [Pyrinomonadaceae bacterium]|nr:magnesium/cobalt transporter CorA [Pyrinomonadaceae bacterium]
MEIFVQRKGSDHVERNFGREDLPRLLVDKDVAVWVDLLGNTPERVEEARDVMLNVFKFHPLTVEDCLITRRQPKVESFPGYFYFIVHGIKPGETSPTNFATKELDGYLGDNFLLTFHTQRFLSVKRIKEQLKTSPVIMQRGPAFLLHHLLDEIVDLYMPLIDEFDGEINGLEERVFAMRKSSNRVLCEIMDVRRAVVRMRRISSRQMDVLYRMAHGEFPQIAENLLPLYRDVHDHLQRISDQAESYRDLVTGLFDIHFAVVGNRTNDVMKTLAIVSAIILPLSLIAGIYGMNFDNMPELHTRYGYFATLLVMLVIAVALLVYFWRLGWIFQPDDDVAIRPTPSEEEDVDQDGRS